MSRPVSREKVPGTATSPSSTASRTTRPEIGEVSRVLDRLSRASCRLARACSSCARVAWKLACATWYDVCACSAASGAIRFGSELRSCRARFQLRAEAWSRLARVCVRVASVDATTPCARETAA